MTEFELIERCFAARARAMPADRAVRLGIGDDCALLAPTPGHVLAISTDMLVAGRHFFDDVDPAALGWKALAVNLSDLAAMGARPLAFTLALALPSVDEAWLGAFADGLFDCASTYGCALIGGDTTRGPLDLSVTIFGEVVEDRALRRSGARVGDDVWVSGAVGGAALALHRLQGSSRTSIDDALRERLDRPHPRVALGRALVDVAHAAIDVSDGLAQDLGHLLSASDCGAEVWVDAIPLDPVLASSAEDVRLKMALAGGDDYELCFTASPAQRDDVERTAREAQTPVTRIGSIVAGAALRVLDTNGADSRLVDVARFAGFDHFR